MTISSFIETHLPNVIALRHRLHQIPELSYQEFKTASLIRAELDRLGIEHIDGVEEAPTATVALIGDQLKPCIAFRADIDALPIEEETGLSYASTHAGTMHACGHDGHTATLLGAAAALLQIASELPVCIKLIWQPAEEKGAGAYKLVTAGVLDGRIGPKVEAIFGLHGWPTLAEGVVATKAGPLLAATDNFKATFVGQGCHGAYPHMGIDPLITACDAVLSLQQVISREVDPTDSAVITVGMINAGTAVNIIADKASISGTVRTLKDATRALMKQAVRRRLQGIADANRCTLQLDWEEGYPSTVNSSTMAAYVESIASELQGKEQFITLEKPSMGGEDFAYYLQQVPGCFFFIGMRPRNQTTYPALHSSKYDFTDAAMRTGVHMYVNLAKSFSRVSAS